MGRNDKLGAQQVTSGIPSCLPEYHPVSLDRVVESLPALAILPTSRFSALRALAAGCARHHEASSLRSSGPVIRPATSCTKRTVSARPSSSSDSSLGLSLIQATLCCISDSHSGRRSAAQSAACFLDACPPCSWVYSALHKVSTA